jgi:hypothetical protein
MQILRRQSAAVGFSALVLIASLSQADAQARFPCYAKVCVLDKNKFCILALFGPTSFRGEAYSCFCPTPAGTVWGYTDYRRLQCQPDRIRFGPLR